MKYYGDDTEELWDIYDGDRNLTGRTHRRGDPLSAGEYHMVVNVSVFNEEGKLLLQKRNQWKKKYPGFWDLSAGGAAQMGDNSRHAAEREVKEEIGLEIDLSMERPVFSINFKEGFADYYFITLPEERLKDLRPQPEEVEKLEWFTKDELDDLISRGLFVPYVFADHIFEIYANKNSRTCCKEKRVK